MPEFPHPDPSTRRRILAMTQRSRIATIALVILVAVSGTVYADKLFSPPLLPGDGNSLVCQISNLNNAPRDVTVEIIGFCQSCIPSGDGSVLNSLSFTLNPLNTSFPVTASDLTPTTPHFCKFTVEGGKGNYRATACVYSSSGAIVACVPAD